MPSPYTVISNQTVQATAGTGLYSATQVVTKHALCLSAKVTIGTALTDPGRIYLRFVCSPYAISAATAVSQMVQKQTLEIVVPNGATNAGKVFYVDTGFFVAAGLNFYCWVDVPVPLGQTVTLDAQLEELN